MYTRKSVIKSLDAGDIAALVTWTVIFGLCVVLMPEISVDKRVPFYIYAPFFIIYAVCFVYSTRQDGLWGITPKRRLLGIIVMLISAFIIGYLLAFDFLAILTIIWAAVLAHFLKPLLATAVTLIVVFTWFAMMSYLQNELMWIHAILYGTFHMFALLLASSNQREREIANELKSKNDQLVATQHLLTEASKQTERTRIARDLHDLLGHHLTALSIKLQVASRITEGEAKRHVDECHNITKLLLSDVREAVDTLRHSQYINFEESIRLLVENVPKLNIHLSIVDELSIENIKSAQTLFRCIQEAITNSLKHSGATNLWIKIDKEDGNIVSEIYDDGVVDNSFERGNGLKGMEERVSLVNGNIIFSTKNSALKYLIQLPV
ncbi:sensor histidine kinase [Pleionea sediminis]|uniref:sensor histidine kinase n=1 Tax=Pleionea sediminis TaxID=2569479 RepID=UPI0011861C11|nr:histidine kinase [Pleionea sediminis]